MKKLTFLMAFAFLAMTASAQFTKGSIFATGGLNFSSSTPKFESRVGGVTATVDGDKTTQIGLDLFGGYFVANNIAIGFGLGVDVLTESGDLGGNDSFTDRDLLFYLTPALRYYMPMTEKFSAFGQFGIGIGFGSVKAEVVTGGVTASASSPYNMMNIGITPGFTYMMTPKMALEMRFGFFGYTSISDINENPNNDDYDKITIPEFGLNIDLTALRFSFSYFL